MWVLTTDGAASSYDLVRIDPRSGEVGPTIAIPGGTPSFVAVAPSGRSAFAIDGSGSQTLIPIDLSSGQSGTPVPLPEGSTVTSAGFSPTTVYLSDPAQGRLIPVALANWTVSTPISTGERVACGDFTTHTAVTPDDGDVYVQYETSLYDVDLQDRTSSPGFGVQSLEGADQFGDPTIALSPDGSTLWTLQSGTDDDTMVPINTDGDNAGAAFQIPVSDRPAQSDPSSPNWDGLYVVSDAKAWVIAYGSVPERLVPVDLNSHQAGQPIIVGDVPGGASCAEGAALPVAINRDGTIAVVGGSERSTVRVVDLTTGSEGQPIRVGTGVVITAILSPTGYQDWIWLQPSVGAASP
jgi:hypothetical protein